MTRLETPDQVLRWKEARLQTEVMAIAADAGWHVPGHERRELEEQLSAFGLPPEPLPGLVYHDRVAYRSEPGWPDLVMVRRRDRRLLFAELKREGKDPSARQALVLDLLRCLEWNFLLDEEVRVERSLGRRPPRIEVFVWRPRDYLAGRIAAVLS